MASSTPTFQEIVSDARTWFGKENPSICLEEVEEKDRKMSIRLHSDILYIIPPENPSDQWTVWSDSDNAAHVVSPHLDYLGSRSRKIDEILSKLKSLFITQNQKSSTDSEEEEEDDEECEGGEDDEEEEDLEDFYDQYYGKSGDQDADNEEVKQKEIYDDDDDLSGEVYFTGDGSPGAIHRLLQDLKCLKKSERKFGIDGKPRGDNLFIWDIELFNFEKDTLLHKDLEKYAKNFHRKPVVELEMKFPQDYPMHPPFVRVVRPRFQFLTGHVTVGGSVCMQMLTRSGWSPSNDIEGILIQIRSEIMSDPRARLDGSPNREYSEIEAKSAFDRMVMKYGWNR